MLVVFLSPGTCGGGCGGLGRLADAVAPPLGGGGRDVDSLCDFGKYLAFCRSGKWFDYLVIYKKTPQEGPGRDLYDYDPSAVAIGEVEAFEDAACAVLAGVAKLAKIHGALLTVNPFLRAFAVGPTMTRKDVVAYCADDTPKGRWIEGMLLSHVDTAEYPAYFATPSAEPRPLKCSHLCA